MEKQPNESLINAYNRGRELQGKSYEDIVYGGLVPEYYFYDSLTNFFFDCGYSGADLPQWVSGWRYGNIPEGGKSYNYRDDRPEYGVSVMQVDGGEQTQDKISALFIANGRPSVKVAGWLNPLEKGSDGEPLLMGAVTIAE
jgi:hypothetical protein